MSLLLLRNNYRCIPSIAGQFRKANTLSKAGWSISKLPIEQIMTKRKQDKYPMGSSKRQKKNTGPKRFEGSGDEVLVQDIKNLLLGSKFEESKELPKKFDEVEVRISELSSTGDGIGFLPSSKDHAFVVPFSLPGELVKAKVFNIQADDRYSKTDLVEVLEPSPRRDASLIKCKYFAKCSGCQFQMITYDDQLKHKKTIIEKAYKNFSGLAAEAVPAVGDTIGSPLQYEYRTKLTPHFDGPPGFSFRNKNKETFKEMPPFGFMQKNTNWTLDIEECPIGTPAVTKGLTRERERMSKEFGNYYRGATILLRESTERKPKEQDSDTQNDSAPYEDHKTCITDSNATSTEYIDSYIFTNPAGSFFQNNNSILPVFTNYIRDQITESKAEDLSKGLNYLIDAYCGSGLFTVALSSLFKSSMGIDISEASIDYASKNAKLNKVENTKFIAATASQLFQSVKFNPEETLVVIDPPRKGCDMDFLEQLLRFGPRKVAYVSCNVHTQARDVGIMINGLDGLPARYKMDSLRGFDFFPQTGHVEGVAFLSRI